jgi:tellurite resistance-related uncharacterized protein
VYIFQQDSFIQKKTLSIPAVLQIFHSKNRGEWRTLRLMHGGISFDKILPKHAGYLGTSINVTENNLRKQAFAG